jgi:hypothetical protein
MFRGVALSQESTKNCCAHALARFVSPGPAFFGPERAPPAFARAPLQGAPAGLPLVLGRARACFPLPLVHSAALTLPLIRGLVFEWPDAIQTSDVVGSAQSGWPSHA